MKLYYSKGACSLVVRIILNELKISANYEAVDLKIKKTAEGEDFFTINPKGSVPVLALDNGEILTENAVILQYLADTSKASQLLPPVGDFNRYRVLEWLNYTTTEMHKTVGLLFNPAFTEAMKKDICWPMIQYKLTYLNRQLTEKDYLLGDHMTLADPYLFVILRWLHAFKMDFAQWPHVERFYQNMLMQPAVKKSLEEEG